MLAGELAAERAGASVAVPGDLDGDGVPDLVIGAPGANEGAGRVYVLSGARLTDRRFVQLRDEALVLEGAPGSRFGALVEPAGDVDGDGWPDFLVGAPGFFSSQADTPEGRLYLFQGGPGPMAAIDHRDDAVMRITGPHPGAEVGVAASSAGDANGDGLGDFVVLVRGTNALSGTGQAAVITGRAATAWGLNPQLEGVTAWFWNVDGLGAPSAGVPLARTLANAGDINADGYDDLLIGQPALDSGFLDSGAVFLVPGRPDADGQALEPDPAFDGLASIEGDALDLQLGVTISRGRGTDLLWIGSRGLGDVGVGFAYALESAPPYIQGASVTEIRASSPGAVDVLAADLEGDGSAGPLLAQPAATGSGIGAENAGLIAAYASAVGGSLTLETADAIFLGEGRWEAGTDVAVANLDGDAYDDVVVGSPGALLTGAVFVLVGGDLGDGDGFAPVDGDCDDTSAAVNPGAEEVCDDGLDNDCNGFIDGLDAPCGLDGSGVVVACNAAGSGSGGALMLLSLAFLVAARRRVTLLLSVVPLVLLLSGCPSDATGEPPGIQIVSPEGETTVVGLLLAVEVEVTGGRLAPEREGQPPLDPAVPEFLWIPIVGGVERPATGGAVVVFDDLSPDTHNITARLVHAETGEPVEGVEDDGITVALVSTAPEVELTSPDPGSFVSPLGFDVRLDVRGFTFDGGAVGQSNQPGVGHAHLLVNDVVVAEVASREVVTPALDEGDATLSVELVNNDHSPLSPPAGDAIDISIAAPQLTVLTPAEGATLISAPEVAVEYSVIGFTLDPDDVNSPSSDVPAGVGHSHIYLNGQYQGLDPTGSFVLPAVNGCEHALSLILALANHEELNESLTQVNFNLEPCVAIDTPTDGQSVGGDVTVRYATPGFVPDPIDIDGLPNGKHFHFYVDGAFENVTIEYNFVLDDLDVGEHEVRVVLADGDHDIADHPGDELPISATVVFESVL